MSVDPASAPTSTGNVVFAAAAVDDVLEQERLALALRQSAELQPHQRMQFGILVDRRSDANKLAGLVETLDIFA